MARIRTIKPEFQNSQSMGRVSRDARLTFIELWPQCDDAGRIRANSRMLASVLFPYDLDAPNLIDGWLSELETEGCIVRYRVEKDEYLQIIHWDHQKIDHPQPSKLPAPPSKKSKKTKLIAREQPTNDREASSDVRAVSSTVPVPEGTTIKPVAALAASDSSPDWLPVDLWNAFLEMRRKKNSAPTRKGADLLIAKLSRLRDAGNDPALVIEASIENSWKGFFPLRRDGPIGASPQRPTSKIIDITAGESDVTH